MSHNGQKHDEEDRQIYTQMDFDIGNSRGIFLSSKNAIHWLWLKNSILSKVKTCGIENQTKVIEFISIFYQKVQPELMGEFKIEERYPKENICKISHFAGF